LKLACRARAEIQLMRVSDSAAAKVPGPPVTTSVSIGVLRSGRGSARPENVHLYRAAVLAWRKATIEERSKHANVKLSNPHVAEHAAARAVHELAPEMTYAQASLLTEKATKSQMVLAWHSTDRVLRL
jgi:hypothetical protein